MKKRSNIYIFLGGILILVVIFVLKTVFNSYKSTKATINNSTESYLEKIKPEVKHNGKMFVAYKQLEIQKSDNKYTEEILVLYQEYFKENNNLKSDDKKYMYYKIFTTKHSKDNYSKRADLPIMLSENSNLDNISKEIKYKLIDISIRNDLENKIKQKAEVHFNK